MGGWIDVSVPIRDRMAHWPGDPAVRVRKIRSLKKGDACDLSLLSLGSHTGTHMDAPAHFIPGAAAIDGMPLSATVGPARVIPIRDPVAIRPQELSGHSIRRGQRILFRTRNSGRVWKRRGFVKDFVYLSEAAARLLAEKQVRCVGVDYLSVGGFGADGAATHKALLSAGVWIVEGLDLSRVRPGNYDLLCLPLRLDRGDGAPARAILRPR